MIRDQGDEEIEKKTEDDEDEPETLKEPRRASPDKPLTPDANPIDPRVFGGGGNDGRH